MLAGLTHLHMWMPSLRQVNYLGTMHAVMPDRLQAAALMVMLCLWQCCGSCMEQIHPPPWECRTAPRRTRPCGALWDLVFCSRLEGRSLLGCQGIWLCRACTLVVFTGSCGLGQWIRGTVHHYVNSLSMENEHRAYNKSGKQGKCCILIHQHSRNSWTRHSLVGGTVLPCWHGMTSKGSTVSGGWCGCKGGTPAFQGHGTSLTKSIQVLKQALSYCTSQSSTLRRFRVGLACACGTQKQNGTGLKITWMLRLYIQLWLGFVTVCNCQIRHVLLITYSFLMFFCLLAFFIWAFLGWGHC